MKAIIIPEFGEAKLLRLAEVPPPQPGPTQLRLNVKAVGMNRADLLQRRGYYPPPPGDSEILGLEVAGIVESCGDTVTGFRPGDRVFGLISGGGYAEQALLDFRMAMLIPPSWDFVQAASIPEGFFTANETLFQLGGLKSGEKVLIHAGGSGVGTIAIQMARHAEAEVFVTAGSWQKLERCRQLGSHVGIDYKTQDFVEEIRQRTEGLGVHLIQDFIGAAYLNRNLQALRHEGRLLLVGMMGGTKAELNLGLVISKRLKIWGSIMRTLPLAEKIAIKQRFEDRWFPLILEEKIRPVIDSVFPLERATEAHEYMEANQHFGKIILKVE